MRPSGRSLRVGSLARSLALTAAMVTAQPTVYAVSRVVDGDTVVLETVGTVRPIGVDTPETVDPRKPVQEFGQEASAFLKSMLTGKSVRLEYDQQGLDKYRRTLAYLFLPDGTFAGRGLWGDSPVVEQAASTARQVARVWVNTSSKVYHCPGARYYGNTARGEYNRPASGRSCS